MFADWNQNDYLVALPCLTKVQVHTICKLKDKVLAEEAFEVINETDCKDTGAIPSPSHDSQWRLSQRKFGQKVSENLHYVEGTIMPTESGGSTLDDPAREYKLMELKENQDIDGEYKRSFIRKAGKFIIACLNKRCNGTMYLGIGDSHGERFQHGQVVGLHLNALKKEWFQEMMTLHFIGKNPQYFKNVEDELKYAVQNCVSPIRFVPLFGFPNMYVVEFDVEPAEYICKSFIFYTYDENPTFQKETGKKKKRKQHNQLPDRIYFIREGTGTNRYDTDDKKELKEKVDNAIKEREKLEKADRFNDRSIIANLDRLLCQNRSTKIIDDVNYKLVLLNAVGSSNATEITWIEKIKWHLILDLSMSGKKSSVVSKLYSSKINSIARLSSEDISEIADKETKELLEESEIGERLLLITSSTKQESDWFAKDFKAISELILQAFHPSKHDSSQPVICITLVGEETLLNKASAILSRFSQRIGPDQIVCLGENKALIKKFERLLDSSKFILGEQGYKQFQVVPWNQLNAFVLERIKKVVYSGMKIVSGSGILVDLDPEFIKINQEHKIDILPSNFGDEIYDMPKEKKETFCLEGNQAIKRYLQGGEPTWTVFAFSNDDYPTVQPIIKGVIKRELVQNIQDDLKASINFKDRCVFRKRIVHQPGSGATTIGKHVLWELRKKMKCIQIDGNDLLDAAWILMMTS